MEASAFNNRRTTKANRPQLHIKKMEENINPLNKLVAMMEFRNNLNQKFEEVSAAEKEKAEKEIMMDLWGWLSNNTETYTDAFNAIEAYNAALRKARMKLIKNPHAIMVKLTESVAAQLSLDAELYKKLHLVVEKMEPQKPN
jgi:hypothetical protein